MHSPSAPPPPPPDRRTLRELARSAHRGDEEAFTALHRRLTPGLRRLLLDRVNQRHDAADDIIQRTWLAVWEALRAGRYDESKSAITTFVYAVGYKVWLQHLRKTQSAAITASDDALDSHIAGADDPADAAPLAELLESLRAALSDPSTGLTDDERWLVREAASGASDRDLARELNLAPSTINARKRAALDKIRRFLARQGHRELAAERPTTSDE
ncbi:MAG TPA: sigma-70 family RNA polymerase sigma factor [Phycisphaerales bacterium]|nr:sigma-70 family RNA polymerase sigma factor [Phycisphaerales bacterium]